LKFPRRDSDRHMAEDVSVVIPSYNRAHLIGRTLTSVFAQTQPAAEVIVVDDGSDDCTKQVVGAFGEKVKYVRIENAGVTVARNAGAGVATGEWLAFLDSDDLWAPDRLQRHHQFVALAPQLQYVFSDFSLVIDDKWCGPTKLSSAPAEFLSFRKSQLTETFVVVEEPLFERLLSFQPIFPSAFLIRRGFFERLGGWDQRISRVLSEDLEFALRCTAQSPIGLISEALVGIRKHAGNASGVQLRTVLGEIEVLNHVLTTHKLETRAKIHIEQEIIRRSAGAASLAFVEGKIEIVRESIKAVPSKDRDMRLLSKAWIAILPKPIAKTLCATVCKIHDMLARTT
jgi:glycosyltransferase involved in cell wall biosynthesis